MSKQPVERPRGEAAWKAAKKRVEANNELAYARGREERAARNTHVANERRAAERRDRLNLPRQPGR